MKNHFVDVLHPNRYHYQKGRMVDAIILTALLRVVLALRGYWWYKRGRIFFLSTPPCSLRACTQTMVLLLLFSNDQMLMSILMLRPCLLLSVHVQIQDIKDVLSYTHFSNSSCHPLTSNFAPLVTFLADGQLLLFEKIYMNFLWFSPTVPRQLSYLNLVPSASQLPSHILAIACTTSFYQILQFMPFKFGQCQLVMKNYPGDLRESETEKYFK